MGKPVPRALAPDPTHYPVEETVPESALARKIGNLLVSLVERWLVERGERAFAGADQFMYYRQYDPHARVAPDVYVLPGVDRDAPVTAWKTWETGIVPSIAFEIVGLHVYKDYEESPLRYEEMGVREPIVFDPEHEKGPDRVLFQLYRRKGKKLAMIEATSRDRIRSRVLGCFLRSVGEGQKRRLRLATGPRGDVLYPTAEETRAAAEAELDRERAAREAAETELARLRTELERRR